ncbi:MAG: hypothetical protein IT204_05190 [Fimbriimonadaceae bacterium]|nr:hypothetical protein [Fimbriimonadaceae bacterium]
MRSWFVALCAALTLSALPAAEVYARFNSTALNKLANPGFNAADGRIDSWGAYQGGYTAAVGAGREGGDAARCVRPDAAGPGAGVLQVVTLNQTEPLPVAVSGWSRAVGVSGAADVDYSIYCDLTFTDGTPLWGQISSFEVGTHGWQRRQVLITAARPIRSVSVYGLFRGHTGEVWFDDFSLAELTVADGAALLDGVAVKPVGGAGPSGGSSHSAGPLSVRLQDQRVTGLSLGGSSQASTSAAGFLVRDVAADSGYHDFTGGTCAELGLQLTTQVTAAPTHLTIDGELRDLRGGERAVTLLLALPVRAAGLRWGADIATDTPISGRGSYSNLLSIECGANGQLAMYPFANVSGPAGGVNIGIDLQRPYHFRTGYQAGLELLTLSADFALTPITKRFPSRAPFRILVFPSDSAWGFRSALARYQQILPEVYQVRTPDQGIWQAFAKTSLVQGWEDFGFKFKEGHDETAWDEAHGLLTFRYSEMGTYWMSMPPDLPRTIPNALELLQKQAADPQSRSREWAQATLEGGMHDRAGNLQLRFENQPWCNGAVFSLNPSPYLDGPCQARLAWNDAAKAAYRPGTSPALDGEYLDSLEGYVTAALNFRPAHLAATSVPLSFTTEDHRPVLHKAFSINEFADQMARDVHGLGKLMFANAVPHRYCFMTAHFDIMGTETNWLWEGQYRPDDDASLRFKRSLCGARPYLLLQNTSFADFGPFVERYFQRALAYGMLPSMFSHNAAEDHYFTKPEWYNRDRAAFRKWIPQIRQVAEEGWQPVTGARVAPAAISVERFGPGKTGRIYFTVHNNSAATATATVTFDATVLGHAEAPRTVSLAPWQTVVIALLAPPR